MINWQFILFIPMIIFHSKLALFLFIVFLLMVLYLLKFIMLLLLILLHLLLFPNLQVLNNYLSDLFSWRILVQEMIHLPFLHQFSFLHQDNHQNLSQLKLRLHLYRNYQSQIIIQSLLRLYYFLFNLNRNKY